MKEMGIYQSKEKQIDEINYEEKDQSRRSDSRLDERAICNISQVEIVIIISNYSVKIN